MYIVPCPVFPPPHGMGPQMMPRNLPTCIHTYCTIPYQTYVHIIPYHTTHTTPYHTYNTTQYNTIHYALQYNTIHYTLQYNTNIHTITYNTIPCNTMQYNTYNRGRGRTIRSKTEHPSPLGGG